MFPRGSHLVAAILALGIGSLPSHAQIWHLTGQGGDLDLGETPIVVSLDIPVREGVYLLEADTLGESIRASVFQDGDRRRLATILPRVPAAKPFSYRMNTQPAAPVRDSGGIRFRPDGRNLRILLDDRPFSVYRLDVGHKPFFFPLIGPTGASYTRAYPTEAVSGEDRDHPHQRSFWFTHGKVNAVDFWSEEKTDSTIREIERKIIVAGPVLGRLWTRNAWLAPGDRKVCEDERTVTFYRTKGPRVIDFEITIHATDGPLTFGDTKEGMFGLRVASSMDVNRKAGGRITNAEGLTDLKAWGQASPWVDYVGPGRGQDGGGRHPQPSPQLSIPNDLARPGLRLVRR